MHVNLTQTNICWGLFCVYISYYRETFKLYVQQTLLLYPKMRSWAVCRVVQVSLWKSVGISFSCCNRGLKKKIWESRCSVYILVWMCSAYTIMSIVQRNVSPTVVGRQGQQGLLCWPCQNLNNIYIYILFFKIPLICVWTHLNSIFFSVLTT